MMKTTMLATASAVMFAAAASAGEPVRLGDAQLDNVTAGLAIGAVIGGASGIGTGAKSKFTLKNLNKIDSKLCVGAGASPAITSSTLVWSEQSVDASGEGAGGTTSSAAAIGLAAAGLVLGALP